ncbi:MAG: hypothetical protein KDC61_02195, partial [Saprospiraceae bacterium]|nr:hypothetical protein [Saprospiraceae bacterium]
MTVKLFELTPLGEFFFGGEATFGPENRHYYVRSNLLPQQTSLLGLLRHELLKSNPQAFDLVTDRIRDKTAAAELVGSQGFDGSTDKAFGIIEGLSPVFLLDEKGTPYFLQARLELMDAKRTLVVKKSDSSPDFQVENLLAAIPEKAAAVEKTSKNEQSGYQLTHEKMEDGRLVAKPYDAKSDFKAILVDKNGRTMPVHFDKDETPEGVFIKIEKTGNRKDYSGISDDLGFFKQDMFKLRKGWRFAFLAAFNNMPAGFSEDRRTYFGAERRPFRLKMNDPETIIPGATFVENAFPKFESLYGG